MPTEKTNSEKLLDKRIALMENNLARQLGWVRASESRLALILPLSTAMLGSLAVMYPSSSEWTCTGGIPATIAGLLLLLSIISAALAVIPRTRGPEGSLIFFGSIAEVSIDQYVHIIKESTMDNFLLDLIKQCHRNAQIARAKYACVFFSLMFLFSGTFFWIISIFVLYK